MMSIELQPSVHDRLQAKLAARKAEERILADERERYARSAIILDALGICSFFPIQWQRDGDGGVVGVTHRGQRLRVTLED